MASTDPRPGLYQKFNVERIHGTDKPGEEFFVLSPTHDPSARQALAVRATSMRRAGYVEVADDVDEALGRVLTGGPFYPVD